jgi:polyisoprenoid-binding protein YceI
VRGTFDGLVGRIVESADPGRSTAEISLAVATIRTSNRVRDRHLRSSHYFDATRFPAISFRASAIRTDGDRTTVSGQLTVRDVTRDVEVVMTRERARITSPDRDGRLRLRGTMRIDRLDFGVRGAGLVGLADGLIGRAVDCEIDLEAARTG